MLRHCSILCLILVKSLQMAEHGINASNHVLSLHTLSSSLLLGCPILLPALQASRPARDTLGVLLSCQPLQSFVQVLKLLVLLLPELRVIQSVSAGVMVRRVVMVHVLVTCSSVDHACTGLVVGRSTCATMGTVRDSWGAA